MDLKVAYGDSRLSKQWVNKKTTFDELCARFETTRRTTETVAEYKKYTKDRRDGIKDVLSAFNTLMASRDGLIEDCRLAQAVLCDISAIDAKLAELRREIEVVTELSRKAIYENARTAVNQSEWSEHNNAYLERHRQASERVDELEAQKRERLGKSKILEGFIRDIESRPLALDEFDDRLWLAIIDRVAVGRDGTMTFLFRNGTEITA